ncbi:30S ribosomal protein S18, partial [Candidatus Cerribacteria bacterium 'Amazon FNV 2010 28 9']
MIQKPNFGPKRLNPQQAKTAVFDYKKPEELKRFITERGSILSR